MELQIQETTYTYPQVSNEQRIADAVRAALGDLMPESRDPESIADSETLFVDLGLNSLEYLELWTSIESRVGCRFDDEDLLGDIRTVGDVVRRTMDVCLATDELCEVGEMR
jgi:acyl carrier protein